MKLGRDNRKVFSISPQQSKECTLIMVNLIASSSFRREKLLLLWISKCFTFFITILQNQTGNMPTFFRYTNALLVTHYVPKSHVLTFWFAGCKMMWQMKQQQPSDTHLLLLSFGYITEHDKLRPFGCLCSFSKTMFRAESETNVYVIIWISTNVEIIIVLLPCAFDSALLGCLEARRLMAVAMTLPLRRFGAKHCGIRAATGRKNLKPWFKRTRWMDLNETRSKWRLVSADWLDVTGCSCASASLRFYRIKSRTEQPHQRLANSSVS